MLYIVYNMLKFMYNSSYLMYTYVLKAYLYAVTILFFLKVPLIKSILANEFSNTLHWLLMFSQKSPES